VAAKVSFFGHSTKLLGQKLAFVLFFANLRQGFLQKTIHTFVNIDVLLYLCTQMVEWSANCLHNI
jgi:hypothetical protein